MIPPALVGTGDPVAAESGDDIRAICRKVDIKACGAWEYTVTGAHSSTPMHDKPQAHSVPSLSNENSFQRYRAGQGGDQSTPRRTRASEV